MQEGSSSISSSEKLASGQEPQLMKPARLVDPRWRGKLLRVAVGQPTEKEQEMAVPFAVLNASTQTIELLPPQYSSPGPRKISTEKKSKRSLSPLRITR